MLRELEASEPLIEERAHQVSDALPDEPRREPMSAVAGLR